MERAALFIGAIALSVAAVACRSKARSTAEPAPSAAASSAVAPVSSIAPPTPLPTPRKGMVFIPGGALVAGTPPEKLPRIADEEMPGEQVILKGFYIDVFPYPNEEGAIPLTNLSEPEAEGLCSEAGKRLCTELEWERACKGPSNQSYEYGDRYRPDLCATGTEPSLRPSGLHVGCRSEFGVRDLHGGVWEWTSSLWKRGKTTDLITIRGGNAASGELVARCANASSRPQSTKNASLGFRCCSGEQNPAEVVMRVTRGQPLEARATYDKKLARAIERELPPEAMKELTKPEAFRIDRSWIWHPIGNEELVLLGGCTGLGTKPSCGVLFVRIVLDRPSVLAWASSGHWVAAVHSDVNARDVWVFGGDDPGSFRRLVSYVWGRINIGSKERRLPTPKKKKKKKK